MCPGSTVCNDHFYESKKWLNINHLTLVDLILPIIWGLAEIKHAVLHEMLALR